MKNDLYVFDLDGTLLNSNSRLSDYTASMLRTLVQAGGNFTIATARSLHSTRKVTANLDLKGPVIVYNGACIVEAPEGKILYANPFAPDQQEYIQNLLALHDLHPLVYALVDGVEKVFWHREYENPAIKDYLNSRGADPRFAPKNAGENIYQGEIFYYSMIGSRDQLEGAYAMLRDDPNYLCSFKKELYNNDYWLEIVPHNATKAYAITQLKKWRHFNRVIVFGDEINDLEMFQVADYKVAVANAVPALKKLANEIVASNDEDGVAHWIEANVLAKVHQQSN